MYRPASTRLVLGAGLLMMLILAPATACGGPDEPEFRPLPEEQRALGPGEYRSEEFEPSLSFRVGEGWTNSPPEVFDVLRLTRGNQTGGLGFLNLQGARFYKPTRTGLPYLVDVPKDMVGWFEQHPYLRTDKPEPVEVGGVEGVQLDVVVEGRPDDHVGTCGLDCVDIFRSSSAGPPVAFREQDSGRVIFLEDIEGETVILGFGSPATEFDEYAPEARKVIDTVRWRVP